MEENKGSDDLLDMDDDQTTFQRLRKGTYYLSLKDALSTQAKGTSSAYTINHNRAFTIRLEGPLWATMSDKPWIGIFEVGVLDQLPSLLESNGKKGPADFATHIVRVKEPSTGFLSAFAEESWDVKDEVVLESLHAVEDKEAIAGTDGFVNSTLRSVVTEVTRVFPNRPRKKAFIRWAQGSASADDMATWTTLKIGGTYAQRSLAAQLLRMHAGSTGKFVSPFVDVPFPALREIVETPLSITLSTSAKAKPGRYELAAYWRDQRIDSQNRVYVNSVYSVVATQAGTDDDTDLSGPEAAKLQDALAFVEKEFDKIVGMDEVKKQIKSFVYDTFIEDQKRKKADMSTAPKKPLYHMAFLGSPGTGKTTMAKIVVQVLRKMGIVNNKEEILDTPSPLIGAYVGQTIPLVKAVVEKARGGVVLIDEAHELTESTASGGASASSGFGQEALNAIMASMYPDPAVTFIFCGYKKEMNSMMGKNPGFVRRILYRFTLPDYKDHQLVQIFARMLPTFNEELEAGALYTVVPQEISQFSTDDKMKRNAGIIEQWIRYARKARNEEISIDPKALARALAFPDVMSILSAQHVQTGAEELKQNL